MNKQIHLLLTLLLIFLLSATSALAENKLGFRLTVGATPGIEDLETKDSFGTIQYDLKAKTGFNFNPAFVFRSNIEKPVGFVGIAGFFVRHHVSEDLVGEDDPKMTAFGINLAPGIAVKLGERSHLELRAELAFGSAMHDIASYPDMSGPYSSIGANAGVYFQLSRIFVLGFDVGYVDFKSDAETDEYWETYDSEMSGSGATANVSMGFMF